MIRPLALDPCPLSLCPFRIPQVLPTRGFQGRETTMRRSGWLTLGLALTAALAVPAARAAEDDGPKAVGTGPAYRTLGRLPVLHEGRPKPLDTLAREEVKQIFGRETIKIL